MHRFRGWTRPAGEFRPWLPEGCDEPATGRFVAGLPVTDLDARRTFDVVAEPRGFLPSRPAPAAENRFRLDDPPASDLPILLLNDA